MEWKWDLLLQDMMAFPGDILIFQRQMNMRLGNLVTPQKMRGDGENFNKATESKECGAAVVSL